MKNTSNNYFSSKYSRIVESQNVLSKINYY